MSDIDWSKAPEGATHFQPRNDQEDTMNAFWRVEDGAAREVWCFDDSIEFLRHHFKYGPKGCIGFHPEKCVERPQEWTGEGLPPVGIKVVLDDSQYEIFNAYKEMIGVEVLVLASFKSPVGFDMIVCALPDGLCGAFLAEMAKPIRTPEQIAAEERERAINEMESVVTGYGAWEVCANLYDAGYRKQEQPK